MDKEAKLRKSLTDLITAYRLLMLRVKMTESEKQYQEQFLKTYENELRP